MDTKNLDREIVESLNKYIKKIKSYIIEKGIKVA